jgi:hypothetical protein
MLFAFTFYGLILGAKPLRIFQSVASGVLGRATAIEGGIRTFLLGILLHFVVATCIATVYYLATLILPVLLRHAVVSGLMYGMIAYLGMSHRQKSRPAATIYLSDRNHWARFFGRIAARTVDAPICESEYRLS